MCGVFGVVAPGQEAARIAALGIFALQHRGQESAGIAVSDGEQLMLYKDLGLIAQVLDDRRLPSLRGELATATRKRPPRQPQIAISASTTARPPPLTSWAAVTERVAIASRINAWTADSAPRSRPGRSSSAARPASAAYALPPSPGP